MSDSPVPAFELLAAQLLEDPDRDVSVTATGLHVHGRLFAYLDGTDLALDLRDAEVDRRVHVLGRLVTRDGEPVVQLEADVDAVVMTLCRENDVTRDGIG